MPTFQNTVRSIFIGGVSRKNNRDEIVGVFIREKDWLENSLSQSDGRGRFRVEKQAVEGKDRKWRPTISSQLFFLLTQPMKMEQTVGSKTSAYKIQMPGNYPKDRIQHSEHESLKLRKKTFATLDNLKTNTENIRGLNWVVVKCTSVQYTVWSSVHPSSILCGQVYIQPVYCVVKCTSIQYTVWSSVHPTSILCGQVYIQPVYCVVKCILIQYTVWSSVYLSSILSCYYSRS